MAALTSFGLDVGVYGPLADAETILSLARHAEEIGLDDGATALQQLGILRAA